MSTEYDPIVRQYRRSKTLPFRVFSEIPNHLELLGPVGGLAILDVACGEGFYTRLIREAGATRAVGVDVSAGMIDLARRQEAERPLGIEYVLASADAIPEIGLFDIVANAFLFNTAADRQSLAGMARCLAANLKPGGRLVATLGDLCCWPRVDYRPYGMATEIEAPLAEGAPYQITFLMDEDTFSITDFAWSHGAIEDVLRAAGFDEISWRSPTITAEGMARFGEEFWQTYLKSPPVVRLEARRR